MKNWLHLMQLTDSNLPSGAFSHSFGLETFIQKGDVTNRVQFEAYLRDYIVALSYNDGLACIEVLRALRTSNWQRIIEVDHILYASTSAKETRIGTQKIAQQLLKLYSELYKHDELAIYKELVQNKRCFGHPSIAQTFCLRALEIEEDVAIQTVLYTACSSLIQNAVRGIPLGQTDGQRMLQLAVTLCQEMVPKVMAYPADLLGTTFPHLEVKQMQHEKLHVRLFMS